MGNGEHKDVGALFSAVQSFVEHKGNKAGSASLCFPRVVESTETPKVNASEQRSFRCISFLVCKTGIITMPPHKVCCHNENDLACKGLK